MAFTAADLEATCAFYERLFAARKVAEHAADGKILVRQISVGHAVLSVHQAGNGLDLVARHPTVGAADFCLRWGGHIDEAAELLRAHGIGLVEGPVPRRSAAGRPSQSVYFRDPDGNLVELMAEECPG